MEVTDTLDTARLSPRRGLGAADAALVRVLADEVRRADGVELKLNLPRPEADPTGQSAAAHVSDLCYSDGGLLVGYAPLDGDGDELEVTAAVLPSHRRHGIFRLLLGAARREARRRGARRLLLVGYRASVSGAAAVQALGLPYVSSEFRMEAEAAALPPLDPGRLRLIPVDETNVTDLARLMGLTFGESWSAASLTGRLRETGARYFIAEADGARIGQIGVVDADGSLYVRGVGIVPEHRRRGHGRHLLAATLQSMLSEGRERFALDVATENPQALSLYESCGFRVAEAYDYHDVPLAAGHGS
jgi:ribosomal protein S18 acetylase RimI-like enzyme